MPSIALPQLMRKHNLGPPLFPKRMVWTASSLKLFRSCKRKWFWKYIMRLVPRVKDKNLVIGGAFHDCVAYWYRRRRSSMNKIVKSYTHQLRDYLESKAGFYSQSEVDSFDVAINNFGGMLIGYAENYARDRERWRIDPEMIERQFIVHFQHFDYAGKIDLGVDRKNHRIIVEHKTAIKLRAGYFTRLPLDTQCRGYMLGATEGVGFNPDRVLYDVTSKSKLRRKSNESVEEFNTRVAERYIADPPRHFYREPIPVQKEHIETFKYELHQAQNQYETLVGQFRGQPNLIKACVQGNVLSKEEVTAFYDHIKDPRAWEPNDDYCDQYFKQCEFLDLCLKGLDKGTSRGYEQKSKLHEELEEEEDED